uniref:ORF6 n=1 Tax=Barley yellow dwarf virus (isolate PAV) TaxID=2169986 RepID=A0A2L0E9B2_BYDVP|nr:ORF6 [Barley yellow dwarf virus PAV]
MEDLHVIAVCILALTVLSGVGAVLSCCHWCCSSPLPPSRASV